MTTRINPVAPRLKWDVLDPRDLERIHEATLEIMEEVGIRFPSDRALAVLEGAGCDVDRSTEIVKLPRALVMEAAARRRASICSRGATRPPTCSSTAGTAI